MKVKLNFSAWWSGAAMMVGVLIAGVLPATSHALTLSASDAICTSNDNGGNDTSFLSGCDTSLAADLSGLTLLYKANRGSTEEGDYSGDYSTSFNLTPGASATISYVGPDDIDCPFCYLIAKDGDSEPNFFLFDLTSWNGTDQIVIGSLFFKPTGNPNDDPDAVTEQNYSHVSIWGKPDGTTDDDADDDSTVPEPGVLFLMGAGLLGLGMARRRKSA